MHKFIFGTLLFFISLLFFSSPVFSQEKDIVPYLKLIEDGSRDSVLKVLPGLKNSSPNDPSVLFLEGVLTENGQDAVPVFNRIISDFPKSKYADASVYRLYSYYYSLGLYNTAGVFLNKLKKEYPGSPYIKMAENNIPSENEPSTSSQDLTSGENSKNFRFTIQAGAFGNGSNAISLKTSFENAGYYSFIRNKSVGGSEFKVVYVGRFVNRDEAESFLHVVNNQFDLKGRIVPIN